MGFSRARSGLTFLGHFGVWSRSERRLLSTRRASRPDEKGGEKGPFSTEIFSGDEMVSGHFRVIADAHLGPCTTALNPLLGMYSFNPLLGPAWLFFWILAGGSIAVFKVFVGGSDGGKKGPPKALIGSLAPCATAFKQTRRHREQWADRGFQPSSCHFLSNFQPAQNITSEQNEHAQRTSDASGKTESPQIGGRRP